MKSKPIKLNFLPRIFSERLFITLSMLFITLGTFAQGWEQVNDSPFGDDHTNSFGHNGKGYVFRGSPTNNGNGLANEVWQYTPESDSWEMIAEFPGPPRRISIGDDWEGKYYYGFGASGDDRLSDLWVFDPEDMSFTELPSCPCIGRTHPSLIAHNDKVFMGGGSSENGDVRDWWEYDMITQEWSQKPDIPGGVRHHTFHFSSGDYVYVGGGHVANWNRFDPATEEWTPIDDLPAGRVAGTQFNYAGLGFILAGDDRFHSHVPDFETFMFYNPESMEWDYLPPLPNGSRWAPSSFLIENNLYFLAGFSDIVNGDVTMWKFDMNTIGCIPPSGLSAIDVSVSSAGLLWSTNGGSDSDTLLWRKAGEVEWNRVVDAEAVYQLDNLETCQDYEFQIIKVCGSESSASDILSFSTDGCCVNPELTVNSITTNSAVVNWPEILAADEYSLRWKAVDDVDWSTAEVSIGPYELTDLSDCTLYELQIESLCSIDDIEYSESQLFRTLNCGACLDVEYCKVPEAFAAEFVFINKVGINNYINESANNGGYGNFDGALTEDLIVGETFDFTFEPGFVNGTFPFTLKVWIDLDMNGDFEESELVLSENSVGEEILREIEIPDSASLGLTRMRVYYTDETNPCAVDDDFIFGEAEDYCLNIVENPTSTNELGDRYNSIEVFPNPFQNSLILKDKLNIQNSYSIEIINPIGETIQRMKNYSSGEIIQLNAEMNSGVYFLIAENESERLTFKIVKQD